MKVYKIHKQGTKDSFGNENMYYTVNETYEKDDTNKFHKEYKSETWQWGKLEDLYCGK